MKFTLPFLFTLLVSANALFHNFLTIDINYFSRDSEYLPDYVDFINKYDKDYNLTEFWNRYQIFTNNLEYINEFNTGNHSYQLGINRFADLTFEEFKGTYLMNPYNVTHYDEDCLYHEYDLPDSIDWRAMGYVTDVKDQGQCGSCWAFSAVGAIEGQHAKHNGTLVSLSEQDLVDCVPDCYGCGGGWPEAAMRYVVKNGIDTEQTYPYEGHNDICRYNKTANGANVTGTVNITSGDMGALYNAIATIGPISIAIDAEYNFQLYKSGIFTDTECSPDSLNHAVLAVGYSHMNGHKYVIVKNSWNTNWGMDGYIYMSADIDNMCGIAQDASYPLL